MRNREGTPKNTAPILQSHAGRVSLDEKSARAIARGRIAQQAKLIRDKIFHEEHQFPKKRLAWLRSVEARVRTVFGETLHGVSSDKRKVLAVVLNGFEDERPGWLAATVIIFPFGTREPRAANIAWFSAHAVARLMERLRDVNPMETMIRELLSGPLAALTKVTDTQDLIFPTRTGYFIGSRDRDLGAPVFKTWLPDRLANNHERQVLNALRREERIGYARNMTVSIQQNESSE